MAAVSNPMQVEKRDGHITEPLVQSKERLNPSYAWRRYHSSFYLFGGVSFGCASPLFFPALETAATLTVAGYLFTLGSLAFTIADATEWWYFRGGCLFDAPNCVDAVDRRGEGETMGDGVNFAISAVGSFTYFVGSCFFIPAIANYALGSDIFALGSLVIVVAQVAKLVRAHRSVGLDADRPATTIDALAGVGGLFYFCGSWPEPTATYATFFTLGGVAYFASAVVMQYRYFVTLPLPPQGATTSLGPFLPVAV